MARQNRVEFERTLAHHHVDRILDGLGHQPTGVHLVVVPTTCAASVWQDAAVLAIRAIRSVRGLTPVLDVMDFLPSPENCVTIDYDVEATLMRGRTASTAAWTLPHARFSSWMRRRRSIPPSCLPTV